MRKKHNGFLLFIFFLTPFSSVQAQSRDLVQPKRQWKYEIQKPIYASPVIKDNIVFVGGLDSALHAINLISGKLLWKFTTGGEIRSTVAIDGETLLLNGGDGNLYALNYKTGKLIWKYKAGEEKKYDFADYHQASPVVVQGRVYFGTGSGAMQALEVATGKPIWSFQAEDAVHSTPAVDGDKIFFGSFDGHVYALKLQSGELIWKFKTVGQRYFPKGQVQGSPAVYNGLVFIGARDFNIYALDQQKGYCHWNRYLPRGWGLAHTIQDSVLHVGTADERTFFALDPATGKEKWSRKMELLVFGNNAYSKNTIYVGTTIGRLHALEKKTGKSIWTFETDGYLKNHLKYFKEDDSYRDDIYSIIKSNEQFVEVQNELGGIFSTPRISGDYIVFSSTEGSVYCLKGSQ